jgi:hypothetical protein
MPIQEGAGGVPQQTFVRWNDPEGTELAAVNRDGTIFSQGINLPLGAAITLSNGVVIGEATVPILQGKLDVLDATSPQSVSYTATVTTMFCLSVFMESEGDGQNTDTVVGTLSFIDPSANAHLFTCVIHGGAGENIVMETYPVLVEAGTVINFSTAFSAGVMTYDLSVRLVQMP